VTLASGTPRWLALGWMACAAGALGGERRAALWLGGASACATWFFRDPGRSAGPGDLLAAADGRIVSVERAEGGRWRIGTYMGLGSVHVNRSPVAGAVLGATHRPGRHVPALSKDSPRNERLEWSIASEFGRVEVVQIAGALARRIVPYHQPGAQIGRGERLGLIRFGSRVDVVIPASLEPAVRVGQRVRAATTELARGR
jgi:phosphatidylserine decarboxylase